MYKSPRQTPRSNKINRSNLLSDYVIRKHLKPVTICLNELEEWLPYAFRTGRKKEVIEERALFCYLACKHGWGPTETGKYIGLDHSSVLRNKDTVENKLPFYLDLRYRVMGIENAIIYEKQNERSKVFLFRELSNVNAAQHSLPDYPYKLKSFLL
jgi:hypothetical protein